MYGDAEDSLDTQQKRGRGDFAQKSYFTWTSF